VSLVASGAPIIGSIIENQFIGHIFVNIDIGNYQPVNQPINFTDPDDVVFKK